MSDNVFYNSLRLCYTSCDDVTDFQGIGVDPLYKRYEDTVVRVVKKYIEPQYQGFLARPNYVDDDDRIDWYVEKWNQVPRPYNDLVGQEREHYTKIKNDTIAHYQNVLSTLQNENRQILAGAIKYIDDSAIYCYDNKVVLVVWGMTFDKFKHNSIGTIMLGVPKAPEVKHIIRFDALEHGKIPQIDISMEKNHGDILSESDLPKVECNDGYVFTGWQPEAIGWQVNEDKTFVASYKEAAPNYYNVHFVADGNCSITGNTDIKVKSGSVLTNNDLPEVEAKNNYKFTKWSPDISSPIVADITFTACCDKDESDAHVKFVAGEFGTIAGAVSLTKPFGSTISENDIPKVTARDGYKFIGWNVNPLNSVVNNDVTYTAQYEKVVVPWYKRKWFRWLLWILLALLILFLLWLLLTKCQGCGHHGIVPAPVPGVDDRPWVGEDPNVGNGGGIYDVGNPYDPIETPGSNRDVLPPQQGVLPPFDGNIPIAEQPGMPRVVDNRLNVLMENEDKSIVELARAFKNKYQGDEYKVVYYDDVVKRMQIEVPASERNAIKTRLPQEMTPEFDVFVFDEALFEGSYSPSDPAFSDNNKTWYLNAINATPAWDITKGSDSVTVAIIDNGFNLKHEEFVGKVVMPYNVWSHNSNVFYQSDVDHGTHVAGTAIALANNNSGICGIAFNCLFMPVQVADAKGYMTTTSVLDGILYSLYQGADVVNISLGESFMGLDAFPEATQRDLMKNHFKEEERLWNKVSSIAEKHSAIIVVAAGNDNVLAGIDALQRPKNIIVVSAVDKQNRSFARTNFSNYGEYSDISAPGVDIYSCCKTGYETYDGTSMAAPIVSGAVALMKSLNRNLTAEQILCVLKKTGKQVSGNIGPMLQLDKALQKVKSGNFNDCDNEETDDVKYDDDGNPILSTGDVELTLTWNNINDLDLICIDPYGEMIYFEHKRSRSGGRLEVDKNAQGSVFTTSPVEHIYWPEGGAPQGKYEVVLLYYAQHNPNIRATQYSVRVKHDGVIDNYSGTMNNVQDDITICTFTIGSSASAGSGSANGIGDSDRRRLEEERDRLQRRLDDINRQLKN